MKFWLVLLMLAQAGDFSLDPLPGETPAPGAPATAPAGPVTGNAPELPTVSALPGSTAEAPLGANAAPAATSETASATESTAAAAAESPAPAGATSVLPAWLTDVANHGLMKYMIDGGLFMWPILALGVVMLGVIIERVRSLQMLNTDTKAFRDRVLDLLEQEKAEEALALCDREQGPVPAILGVGLRKFVVLQKLDYDPGKIEEQVVKAMDDYGVHITAALEKNLPILATVSSAAPMVGFLGTVQGMIISFNDIVAKMGETNIVEAAAAGIGVALLTTVFGLIVGIPAFVAFNYFTSVINRFVLDVESSATQLIEVVTLHMAMRRRDAGASNGSPETPAALEV